MLKRYWEPFFTFNEKLGLSLILLFGIARFAAVIYDTHRLQTFFRQEAEQTL